MAKRKKIEIPEEMENDNNLSFFQKLLKRKKLLISIVVIVVAIIGIRQYIVGKRNGDSDQGIISKGQVKEELILSGEVGADEYAQLSFPTSGQISWVGVTEGEWVKKGQALTKLDTTVLNSTYQQARATLRAAEASLDSVYDQVQGSENDETFAERDTRTAAEVVKDKAYEAYIAAYYNLRNSTITAPFSGVITYLAHPFSGVNVIYTQTEIELINPETIFFEVTADQNEVIDIKPDQEVEITLDAYDEESFSGKVFFVGYTPKEGEVGTVYKVKIALNIDDINLEKFRIGMTGDAKFLLNEKENSLYVEPKFISSDREGKYLNVGSPDNRVYVDIGLEGEDRVEVIGEINEGDKIFD